MTLHDFITLMILLVGTSGTNEIQYMKYTSEYIMKLQIHQHFFVRIFFMFEQNLVGNLIFSITYLTYFICCFVNNHGRALIFWVSPSLFEQITLCIAWLASLMSLQILTFLSLSLLPSDIFHKVSIMFFSMCIVSNKWTIYRFS